MRYICMLSFVVYIHKSVTVTGRRLDCIWWSDQEYLRAWFVHISAAANYDSVKFSKSSFASYGWQSLQSGGQDFVELYEIEIYYLSSSKDGALASLVTFDDAGIADTWLSLFLSNSEMKLSLGKVSIDSMWSSLLRHFRGVYISFIHIAWMFSLLGII